MSAPLCVQAPAMAHDFATPVDWTGDSMGLRVCTRCGVMEISGLGRYWPGDQAPAAYFVPWTQAKGT